VRPRIPYASVKPSALTAYTLAQVPAVTSCCRISLMWRRAASGSPAARQALVASGVDGGVEHLLPALDLQHDERLGSIAVRVQRDHARDAGVVLRAVDQVGQLLLGCLAR